MSERPKRRAAEHSQRITQFLASHAQAELHDQCMDDTGVVVVPRRSVKKRAVSPGERGARKAAKRTEAPLDAKPVVDKQLFFKTPQERAQLAREQKQQRSLAQSKANQEATAQMFAGKAVHPLFNQTKKQMEQQQDRLAALQTAQPAPDNPYGANCPDFPSRSHVTQLDEASFRSRMNFVDDVRPRSVRFRLSVDAGLSPVSRSTSVHRLSAALGAVELDGGAVHDDADASAADAPWQASACTWEQLSPVLNNSLVQQVAALLDGLLGRTASTSELRDVADVADDAAAAAAAAHEATQRDAALDVLRRWLLADEPQRNAGVTSDSLRALFDPSVAGSHLTQWLHNAMQRQEETRGAALLWVDKHRPRTGTEVAANREQVRALSLWLRAWREAPERSADADVPRELLDADAQPLPALLLCGPPGSLKTAAVHACARRYQFRVLEINSSAVRTGKQVLQLFAEATQSHHLSAARLGADSEPHSDTVMLFEEVDVRCADDRGFFGALQSLLSSTKRPIVLTCNELTPEIADLLLLRRSRDDYLTPLMRRLDFGRTDTAHLVARCALVALAEGHVLEMRDVAQLALACNADLRRALHALQFWCRSAPRFADTPTARSAGCVLEGALGLAPLARRHLSAALRDVAARRCRLRALPAALQALDLHAHLRADASHGGGDKSSDLLHTLTATADCLSAADVVETRAVRAGSTIDVDEVLFERGVGNDDTADDDESAPTRRSVRRVPAAFDAHCAPPDAFGSSVADVPLPGGRLRRLARALATRAVLAAVAASPVAVPERTVALTALAAHQLPTARALAQLRAQRDAAMPRFALIASAEVRLGVAAAIGQICASEEAARVASQRRRFHHYLRFTDLSADDLAAFEALSSAFRQ